MAKEASLHGIHVDYRENRSVFCVAICSAENFAPFNFLDYFDKQRAMEVLSSCASYVASQALAYRKKTFTDAVELSHAERVFGFISGDLGMEPVGRIVVRETDAIDDYGVTMPGERTCYIFPPRIRRSGHHDNFPTLPLDVLTESVGVHEAVHLAGIPDWMFFTVKADNCHVDEMFAPSPNRRPYTYHARGKDAFSGGWYFEEGFASLIQAMYVWRYCPDVAAKTGTIMCGPPDGSVSIALPHRHDFRQSIQTIAAWGMERLVALCPAAWDVLLASGKYGATWFSVRRDLKRCIDTISPGLFEAIDRVTNADLAHVIEATDRIDRAARRNGA